MRFFKLFFITSAFAMTPATALAAETESSLSPALSTGAGILALVLSAALLIEMVGLRRLAEGSAVAENISFAVLAVVLLAASVLVGWVGRFVDSVFTAEQARLSADLLTVVSIVFFGIYFHRVRRAMSRFLGMLAGQEEGVIAAMSADAEDSANA